MPKDARIWCGCKFFLPLFAAAERHTKLIYPQGLGCTMPVDEQVRVLHSIPGLEEAELVVPGKGCSRVPLS